MTLETIIYSIIALSVICIVLFVLYIRRKQVDFKLVDDGVDELSELENRVDTVTKQVERLLSEREKRINAQRSRASKSKITI